MEHNSNSNGIQLGSAGSNNWIATAGDTHYNFTVWLSSLSSASTKPRSDLRVWIEPKGHSIEGHTAQCTLTFNGRVIWGPHG